MAIDTAEKKLSLIDLSSSFGVPLPSGGGSLTVGQKFHLVGLYSGFVPGGGVDTSHLFGTALLRGSVQQVTFSGSWHSENDPHLAGNRSSYGTEGSPSIPDPYVLTPTGRTAALLAEKNFGLNGYYAWFATYNALGAALDEIVPNEWEGEHILYFEVKAQDRTKMELHRYAALWLFVLNINLLTGAFDTVPSASTAAQWPNDQPPADRMPTVRVSSLGDGWWGVEIVFDFGDLPDEWFVNQTDYPPEELEAMWKGQVQVYFWLVNDAGLWDHVGEVGKGYYLTSPELRRHVGGTAPIIGRL